MEERLREAYRFFERGEMEPDEFRRLVSQILGLDFTLHPGTFERAYNEIFRLNMSVWKLWRRLVDKGYTLTAVSNLCEIRHRYLDQEFGCLHVFDHLVLSYREGLVKPSTELLVRALDISGVRAEETLFIDDTPGNLVPAEALGIRTHRYRSYRGLLRFLKENGVRIGR
jgi:putative hydrolase of the HAD superfamily